MKVNKFSIYGDNTKQILFCQYIFTLYFCTLSLMLQQVIAVGPGPLDEEGNRKPLSIIPGNTVLYSKYAGNDFKGKDDSNYIALRASEVMAILS